MKQTNTKKLAVAADFLVESIGMGFVGNTPFDVIILDLFWARVLLTIWPGSAWIWSARFKTVSWSIFLIKAIFLFPFRPDLTMIRLLNWISLAGFQGQRSFCGQTCIRVLTFAPWDYIIAILPRYLPFVCCKYNIFSSECQFQGAILVNHHDWFSNRISLEYTYPFILHPMAVRHPDF